MGVIARKTLASDDFQLRDRAKKGVTLIPDSRLTVLIVDDDTFLQTFLRHAFTGAGYDVRSADSGAAALSEIDRQIPDILLSDLNMLGMSGFELLAEVRQRFPAIYVIAMSGAYGGDDVPAGVCADVFHEKARGVGPLLQMVADLARRGEQV
jgi:CheY-like chemotaxis protein